MIEQLKSLYNQELYFIREEGKEFQRRFPDIAKRLRISGDSVEDPHVLRLIESFALLTARLRLKIDDEFPEICQSFLQALYPQYLAPVPSTAICKFRLDETGAELLNGLSVPKQTEIETDYVDGISCRYQTCFDLKLLPIEVGQCQYVRPPFSFPCDPRWNDSAVAAICIQLKGASSKMDWSKLNVSSLRLFLGGSRVCGNQLLEALMRDAIGIGLFSDHCKEGVFVERHAISQAGFEPNESLYRKDGRTQAGYRILWEYFAQPEKFRFVDIALGSNWQKACGPQPSIVFYLRRFHPEVQRELSHDTIQLHCSPIVNLFRHDRSEPIRLTENQFEYRVVPDYRTPHALEVHSVESVTASRPGDSETIEFRPFHQPSHRIDTSGNDRYWQLSRRRRLTPDSEVDYGTEVFLTLVDLQSKPKSAEEWILHVDTICCNRDLVNRLGAKPDVVSIHPGGPFRAEFCTAPTATMRPMERDDWLWRLISHLSLNHLSLSGENDAETLREILRLYNPNEQEAATRLIDSVVSIGYRRVNARLADTDKGPGICRGVEVTITLDEEKLADKGRYLFASVLDRFFGLYCTINSFTRLVAKTTNSDQPFFIGQPRCGMRELV